MEHRCQGIEVAQLVHALQDHEQGLVGVGLQHGTELLKLKPQRFRDAGRVFHRLQDQLRECGRAHLHCLALAVKHGGESHDLLHRHTCLCAHARHSLREVGEVRGRGGAVLRQLIDDRAHGKQRLLHAESLLVAEDVGQLRECQCRSLSEVV